MDIGSLCRCGAEWFEVAPQFRYPLFEANSIVTYPGTVRYDLSGDTLTVDGGPSITSGSSTIYAPDNVSSRNGLRSNVASPPYYYRIAEALKDIVRDDAIDHPQGGKWGLYLGVWPAAGRHCWHVASAVTSSTPVQGQAGNTLALKTYVIVTGAGGAYVGKRQLIDGVYQSYDGARPAELTGISTTDQTWTFGEHRVVRTQLYGTNPHPLFGLQNIRGRGLIDIGLDLSETFRFYVNDDYAEENRFHNLAAYEGDWPAREHEIKTYNQAGGRRTKLVTFYRGDNLTLYDDSIDDIAVTPEGKPRNYETFTPDIYDRVRSTSRASGNNYLGTVPELLQDNDQILVPIATATATSAVVTEYENGYGVDYTVEGSAELRIGSGSLPLYGPATSWPGNPSWFPPETKLRALVASAGNPMFKTYGAGDAYPSLPAKYTRITKMGAFPGSAASGGAYGWLIQEWTPAGTNPNYNDYFGADLIFFNASGAIAVHRLPVSRGIYLPGGSASLGGPVTTQYSLYLAPRIDNPPLYRFARNGQTYELANLGWSQQAAGWPLRYGHADDLTEVTDPPINSDLPAFDDVTFSALMGTEYA